MRLRFRDEWWMTASEDIWVGERLIPWASLFINGWPRIGVMILFPRCLTRWERNDRAEIGFEMLPCSRWTQRH